MNNVTIEKISVSGKAFITKDGVRQELAEGMLVDRNDLDLIEVLEGMLTYRLSQEHTATIIGTPPVPPELPAGAIRSETPLNFIPVSNV